MRAARLSAAIACLLAVAIDHAQAQTFGVKGGAARSTIAFAGEPPPADTRARTSALAGGFFGIPIAGRLTVQAEVLFVERRIDFADAPESSASITDTLRYLELPLIGRYRAFGTGLQLFVEGGLGFSRLLTARERVERTSADITSAVESSELSAIAGAAVEWRRLVGGARYLYGLSDVYRGESFPGTQRTLQLSVGYRFR